MTRVLIRFLLLLYRGGLSLGPAWFRRGLGGEVLDALGLRLSAAAEAGGSAAVMRTGGRELVDLMKNIVGVWVSGDEESRPTTSSASSRGGLGMGSWMPEIKGAFRAIVRRPALSAVIILTFAVAIGGTVGVFGIVNGVLLKPLPFPEADRLVYMNESFRETQTKSVAYPNYLDWRERNRVFAGMAARTWGSQTLTGLGNARQISTQMLSANLFDVLQVEPVLGRSFTEEEVARHDYVVVLSHGLWVEAFGGDPDVVGRTITLTGEPYTILGVLPPDLRFPLSGAELWMPITLMWGPDLENRGSHPGIAAIGRLAPDVTVDAARGDMDRVALELAAEYPETNAEGGVNMRTLQEVVVGDARSTLLLLQGAVVLVFLIACANIANLLLVRTMDRRRELAVRVALGVGKARLAMMVLAEGLLLSAMGGVLGVWGASAFLGLVRRTGPVGIPKVEDLALDLEVVAVSVVAAMVAGTLAGFFPAYRSAGAQPAGALREGGERSAARGRGGIRSALVVSEVALAFILLAGTGLMVRSVQNLREANPGLDPAGRVAVQIAIPMNEYPTTQERSGLYQEYLGTIRAVPGVVQAGGVDPLPLSGSGRQRAISNDGFPSIDENGLRTDHFTTTPGYFEAMGIPLLQGRTFLESDEFGSTSVIIDETLAERLWPGEASVVGRELRLRGDDSPWLQVVGVVGHVKNYGIRATSRDQYYTPYHAWVFPLWIVAETAVESSVLLGVMREELGAINPNVPIARVATLDGLARESIAMESLTTWTLTAFAGLAVAMALLGLYGVIAHSVRARTREIGIRMALGAEAGGLVRKVVLEGLVLGSVGVVVGIVAGLLSARVLSSLLFGVGEADPVTFGTAVILMAAMIGLAALMPAVRATRIDPTVALREE